VADEIFGGDHEALPVERELKGGASDSDWCAVG
jgi:hypothetical protein